MQNIKLVSYNIRLGLEAETIIKNLSRFANQGVAIFCLQEVRPSNNGNFFGNKFLASLGLGWKAEYFLSDQNNFDHGLAIFWKADVLSAESFSRLSLPKMDKYSLYEKIYEWRARKSTEPIKRGALVGSFRNGAQVLRVSNVHLDWQGRMSQKIKQIKFLVNHLSSQSHADCEIICGDFNTIGWQAKTHKKEINNILGHEFVSVFPHHSVTCSMWQSLDNVYAKKLKILESEVLKVKGSDHLPLFVNLAGQDS